LAVLLCEFSFYFYFTELGKIICMMAGFFCEWNEEVTGKFWVEGLTASWGEPLYLWLTFPLSHSWDAGRTEIA
jgi:hypothetical protein